MAHSNAVMAFSGPAGITPTLIPSSRALGRAVCAARTSENKTSTKRIRMIADYSRNRYADHHPLTTIHRLSLG